MTSWQAASEDSPTGPAGAFRVIGLTAVFIGVAALAAATFVLSYQGIRAVALQAGIGPRYARGYPLLIDAMLVIALAAVLALRGAGLPSRMLAWLTLLVVLCAAAGADTLHATGRALPHTAAVVTAAVLPWALVFVAFVLLLAMLRHARLRRQASTAHAQASWTPPADNGQARSQQSRTAPPPPPPPSAPPPAPAPPPLPVRSPQPWQSGTIVPGFTSQLVSGAAAGAAAGAAVAGVEPRAEDAAPDAGHVQLADPDQEATAAEDSEPVLQAMAAETDDDTAEPDGDMSLAEAAVPALAAEPTAQFPAGEPTAGEADPLTDQPDAHTGELDSDTEEAHTGDADPLTDEPDAQTGELDSDTEEAQAQPAEDDNDIPAFRRIRSSPTPPEE
ncbi:MAG TPA: DUF2637 domain-containing protein [Streptosporangiaceae bacterium]|jgi:hypothetical protein